MGARKHWGRFVAYTVVASAVAATLATPASATQSVSPTSVDVVDETLRIAHADDFAQHRTTMTTAAASSGTSVVGTGSQRVAAVMFNFAENPQQPFTPAAFADKMFTSPTGVNAFYQASSDGQTSVSGDVFGWYSIAATGSICQTEVWEPQARAAVANAGIDLTEYRYTMFVFPYVSTCSYTGLGYIGGTTTFINGSSDPYTLAHKLGHNTTSVAGAPNTPTGLVVTVRANRQVTLSWDASSNATAYIVRRNGNRTNTVNKLNATDKPGRGTYTYTIVATRGSKHSNRPKG